jgi:hypothetical protein
MKRDEFERNMKQLLRLLKKIMRSHPGGSQFANLLDSQAQDKINLNFCFFNFVPLTREDMEEMEESFAEIQNENGSEDASDGDDFGWNSEDSDFLKRYGMSL